MLKYVLFLVVLLVCCAPPSSNSVVNCPTPSPEDEADTMKILCYDKKGKLIESHSLSSITIFAHGSKSHGISYCTVEIGD